MTENKISYEEFLKHCKVNSLEVVLNNHYQTSGDVEDTYSWDYSLYHEDDCNDLPQNSRVSGLDDEEVALGVHQLLFNNKRFSLFNTSLDDTYRLYLLS